MCIQFLHMVYTHSSNDNAPAHQKTDEAEDVDTNILTIDLVQNETVFP